MKAHLDNLTGLPLRQVKKIVRWTLVEMDIDRPDLLVRAKPARGTKHYGRFYAHAKTNWVRVWNNRTGTERDIRIKLPRGAKHLISAHVAENPWGRTDRQMRGGPPEIRPTDWMESLVCIVAHEGWHFREFLWPQKGRPRHSEVAAEWAEYRLLTRWRERSSK